MSGVLPEKGVCRIVLENTDKNDDNCLDADTESEIEQCETSTSDDEDKIQIDYRNCNRYFYAKELNKKAVKRNECSSESECEYAKKRIKFSTNVQSDKTEQSSQCQNVPHLSYLLENDYNTIRKNSLHQHSNDHLENIEKIVPQVSNDLQNCMEISDAVRRLTELLALPINHNEIKETYVSHHKESEVLEKQNIFDKISMQETNLIQNTDFLRNCSPSTFLSLESKNKTNSLRQFRRQKHTQLKVNCESDGTLETNNRRIDESPQQVEANNTRLDENSHQVTLNKDIKEVEFDCNSNDTTDFNMAVEALNLLKNKGRRIHSNSLDNLKQTIQNIDAASDNISDELKISEESSLADSTVETYADNEFSLDCSKIETKHNFIFDPTLEIRDCSTGAIIPIESIYQNNYSAILTTHENELSVSKESQNEIQTKETIIPSTLAKFSDDTLICVIVPLNSSGEVLSVSDQGSSVINEKDYRHSEHQTEVNQTNDTVIEDLLLKTADKCPSLLPETTMPKENEYDIRSYSEQHQIEDNQTNAMVTSNTLLKKPEKYPSLLPETEIPKEEECNYKRNSEQYQIEVNQAIVTANILLKTSEKCPSEPKENKYKTKSLTKTCNQNKRNSTKYKQKIKSSKSSKLLVKNAKNYKKPFKPSSKLVTKITSLETEIRIFNDQLDEMKNNIEKRRSIQSLKTSECSLKDSFELSSSITNNNSVNEGCMGLGKDSNMEKKLSTKSLETPNCSLKDSFETSSSIANADSANENCMILENDPKSPNGQTMCTKESNCNLIPQDLQDEDALNKCTEKQQDERENGNPEKLSNISMSPKIQISEEKELTIEQDICIKKLKTPLDAFNLFINDSMIKRIVKYTNETILTAAKKSKNLGYKKVTNEIELRAFIGLLLISAALKQNHVKVSELWSECFGASIYRVTLLEGRFYIFLQKLSFCDAVSSDKTDKTDKNDKTGKTDKTDKIDKNHKTNKTDKTHKTDKKDAFKIGDPWEEYLENCKKYPMPKVIVKDHQNYKKDEDSKQQYTSVRKTTNLSLSVLFSMLDTAVIRGTAFFLNENPRSQMCIRTFFKQVGMALVRPQLEEKLLIPTIGSTMRELIQCILSKRRRNSCIPFIHPVEDKTLKKQKRCQLCSWNKDRKTKHQCICCQKNMCKEHRAKLCILCIDSIYKR